MKIDLTCPVELWQYAMPTKEDAECTFVMNNLSDKVVTSVQVTLSCFDENDELVKKERYESLMTCYINKCDSSGFYPVTEELKHMIQNSGKHYGWWDENSDNSDVWFDSMLGYPNLNPDKVPQGCCAVHAHSYLFRWCLSDFRAYIYRRRQMQPAYDSLKDYN